MFKEYPDMMSVKQVAEALHIGKTSAYELIHAKQIGSKRIGRRILVPKICLVDYVTSARYSVTNS